jgi:peptide/nickel transport system permease protein
MLRGSVAPVADVREQPVAGKGLRRVLQWFLRFAQRKPLGFAGLVILLLFAAAALLSPLIAPYPYDKVDFTARLQGPSLSHIFGTDNLGRDLFSRVLFATRVSMGISFAAVVLAKLLATLIAMVSGFYGGWVDKIIQRFMDIWLAMPVLVLLISVLGVAGPSIPSLILVIGLVNVPGSSRLIRSVVVSVREETYIEAARAVGVGDVRLLTRYVLPNIAHIILYSASISLGGIILIVASLGFLGYGPPPPQTDLGSMLSGSGLQFMRRMPWMAIWPGVAIALIVFSFNVLGDALRDVLDPRLRGAR